jgi:O-methyltransferase
MHLAPRDPASGATSNVAITTHVLNAINSAVHVAASWLNFGLASYWPAPRDDVMRNVRKLILRRRILMTPLEACQLYTMARNTRKLPGDMAEVGVYRGASAQLIREASPEKPLHLFDTFEGLPSPSPSDVEFMTGRFEAGAYACTLDSVRRYLDDAEHVFLYKGYFPDTAAPVAGRRFALVHLDADLYDGSLAALRFFYERMNPGGVIVGHDYATSTGVRRAFDEFFEGKPEPVFDLPGNQCMVVKIQ